MTRGGEVAPACRQAGLVRLIMYHVYVLMNRDRRLYIGLTNSLERRLEEHRKGYHRSTKSYRPYRLVHKEIFDLRVDARKREKYLKSGEGREWLKGNYDAGWRSSISQGS